jgi:hypothetical protein
VAVVEQVSGAQSRVAARLYARCIPSSCCICGTLVKRCAVTTLTWRRGRKGMCCGAMRCGVQCHWEKIITSIDDDSAQCESKTWWRRVHMLHTHEGRR